MFVVKKFRSKVCDDMKLLRHVANEDLKWHLTVALYMLNRISWTTFLVKNKTTYNQMSKLKMDSHGTGINLSTVSIADFSLKCLTQCCLWIRPFECVYEYQVKSVHSYHGNQTRAVLPNVNLTSVVTEFHSVYFTKVVVSQYKQGFGYIWKHIYIYIYLSPWNTKVKFFSTPCQEKRLFLTFLIVSPTGAL